MPRFAPTISRRKLIGYGLGIPAALVAGTLGYKGIRSMAAGSKAVDSEVLYDNTLSLEDNLKAILSDETKRTLKDNKLHLTYTHFKKPEEYGLLEFSTSNGKNAVSPLKTFYETHDGNQLTLDRIMAYQGTQSEEFRKLSNSEFQYTDPAGQKYNIPTHDPVESAFMKDVQTRFKILSTEHKALLREVQIHMKDRMLKT